MFLWIKWCCSLPPWWGYPLECRSLNHVHRRQGQHSACKDAVLHASVDRSAHDTSPKSPPKCAPVTSGTTIAPCKPASPHRVALGKNSDKSLCWEPCGPSLNTHASAGTHRHGNPPQPYGRHPIIIQKHGPPIKLHIPQQATPALAPRCAPDKYAANVAARPAPLEGDTATICQCQSSHASHASCITCHACADGTSYCHIASPLEHSAWCTADIRPKPTEESWPRDWEPWTQPAKKTRSRYRADGSRRRTVGEIQKRAPYVQYWKDKQKQQAEREPARGSGPWQKEREPANEGGPWSSWSKWSWKEEDWDTEGQWSRPSRDWQMDHHDDDGSDSADWEDVSSDSSDHGGREAAGTETPPTCKRSRSTQVSEEFVRRQAAAPTHAGQCRVRAEPAGSGATSRGPSIRPQP